MFFLHRNHGRFRITVQGFQSRQISADCHCLWHFPLKSTRKSGNRPFQSDPRKPLSILFLLAEVPLQQTLEGLAVTGFVARHFVNGVGNRRSMRDSRFNIRADCYSFGFSDQSCVESTLFAHSHSICALRACATAGLPEFRMPLAPSVTTKKFKPYFAASSATSATNLRGFSFCRK